MKTRSIKARSIKVGMTVIMAILVMFMIVACGGGGGGSDSSSIPPVNGGNSGTNGLEAPRWTSGDPNKHDDLFRMIFYLAWTPVNGATSYNVYRYVNIRYENTISTTDSTPNTELIANVTDTEYTDDPPLEYKDDEICYYVTAVNNEGESGHPAPFCFGLEMEQDITFNYYGYDGDDYYRYRGTFFSRIPGPDGGFDVVEDSNHNYVIAGASYNGSNFDMTIWRLTPSGTLDTSFNGTGIVTHNGALGVDGDDFAKAIAIDSQGRILVAGAGSTGETPIDDPDLVGSQVAVWRYNPDGTIDDSFGDFTTKGVATIYTLPSEYYAGQYETFQGQATDIVIGRDGRIYVGGYYEIMPYLTAGDLFVACFTNAGIPCNNYGFGGHTTMFYGNGSFVFTSIAEEDDFNNIYDNPSARIHSMAVDSENRIVVTGELLPRFSLRSFMFVLRLNAYGAIDTSFNANGRFPGIVVFDSINSGGYTVAIDSNNRVLVGGYVYDSERFANSWKKPFMWRFTSDGLADNTLVLDERVHDNNYEWWPPNQYISAMAIDKDGTIIISAYGYEDIVGENYGAIFRLNPDGKIIDHPNIYDSSGHEVPTVWTLDDMGPLSVIITDNGKILSVGGMNKWELLPTPVNADFWFDFWSSSDMGVARLLP